MLASELQTVSNPEVGVLSFSEIDTGAGRMRLVMRVEDVIRS